MSRFDGEFPLKPPKFENNSIPSFAAPSEAPVGLYFPDDPIVPLNWGSAAASRWPELFVDRENPSSKRFEDALREILAERTYCNPFPRELSCMEVVNVHYNRAELIPGTRQLIAPVGAGKIERGKSMSQPIDPLTKALQKANYTATAILAGFLVSIIVCGLFLIRAIVSGPQ